MFFSIDAARAECRTRRSGRASRRADVKRVGLAAASLLITLVAIVALPLVANGRTMNKSPDQSTVQVNMDDFFFDPATVEVQPGDTISWTNQGQVAHTTTSADDPAVWDSGSLSPGETFTHTFTTPGTYAYQCRLHPTQMQGEIVVVSRPTSPTPGSSATVTPTATTTSTTPVTPTATTTDTTATPTTGPTPTPLPRGPMVALEEVVSGLAAPVDVDWAPDDSGRIFVVDQVGLIYVVSSQGELLDTPFLDLQDRIVELREGFDERGLLGLAFHPDYAENGRFFVYYSAPLRESAPDDWDHTSHVSEFTVSADPHVADSDSERVILQVDQPQFNHNAGTIAFNRDGFLYVPLGDGGRANDTGLGHPPQGNGQDGSTLLGSILRLDVDSDAPYAVPEDNPFVEVPEVADEIWAYGFRNPYRISFDALTGELFVGDAGQNLWEEVDRVVRGGNYGWNIREGTHCFDPDNPDNPPDTCPDVGSRGEPLLPPVIEYRNARSAAGGLGIAVVGGYMYRGTALSDLEGRYVFGDWSTGFDRTEGKLLVADPMNDGLWPISEIEIEGRPEGLGSYLLAFGQDPDEELYILTSETTGPTGETGTLFRLAPSAAPSYAIFAPIVYNGSNGGP